MGKCFSRENIINIFVSLFPNKKTLDKLGESTDGNLLFNGKEIEGSSDSVSISTESDNAIEEKTDGLYVKDLSSHLLETILSDDGIHGIRYYNSKLQYLNSSGVWVTISSSSSGTGTGDIVISPATNNALTKYSNGYYVPAFLISGKDNNALVKYSDGYYVPKIPANMATTNDIDTLEEEVNDKLEEQSKTFNERYDIITEKLQEVAANTTKSQIHEYSGTTTTLSSIINITTLYSLSSNVILSLEFMIVNNSTNDLLTIVIQENGLETLNDTLSKSEVQRYKLPSIPNIEIFIKGDYTLYLYVTYI